ncbi:MAG: putative glycoside hydrolase, partial [Acidimicrobiia bacterium]
MSRARIGVVLCLAVAACTSGQQADLAASADTRPPPTTAPPTTTPPASTTTVPLVQVSGRVTSDTGAPVGRALVTTGEVASLTGPDGWFALETSTPGTMTVSKPGWTGVVMDWDEATTYYEAVISPQRIRGLRVAADAAGDEEKFQDLIRLADETAVNAFVFDTKQEGGDVLYSTGVAEAYRIGAVKPVYDP